MTVKLESALVVAKWFLAYASQDEENHGITNLKLQNLLYYAQGHHLAQFGIPLFKDQIEAWSTTPVVPSVYEEFKHYKGDPIKFSEEFDFESFEPETNNFLASVWFTFGGYSAGKLRDITHQNGPWKDLRGSWASGNVIPLESMTKYFSEVYKALG